MGRHSGVNSDLLTCTDFVSGLWDHLIFRSKQSSNQPQTSSHLEPQRPPLTQRSRAGLFVSASALINVTLHGLTGAPWSSGGNCRFHPAAAAA